ncbi:hypothetical protein RDI58_006041 [Solanum bulbocastanum]|uniref:NPH3 domain-containing protein n=1 Tax=Solanum bulbocastanum TaxID=147425 RepID=A0AAN8YLI9_SOLBU
MSTKKELLSSAMKRTSEWIFSLEIPSDVTVNAGGISFTLHKFPLVSKSGYIRKLVSESTDADVSTIEIPDIPVEGRHLNLQQTCKDSQFSTSGRAEAGINGLTSSMFSNPKPIVDWWSEDLTVLRIYFFQRVLIAIMGRGFKQYPLGPILMLYAQKSLRCLGRKKIEPKQEHEKKVVLETIVGLLPREKNVLSISFLSMLL